MKKIVISIISLICLQVVFVAGGGTALAISPSTGDKVLDNRLDAINTYAAKDQDTFVSKLSETYHVDKATLEGMLKQGMTPADVYMTLRMGKVVGQSPEQVQKAYLNNPGKGWGVIAKSLGLKPGSNEFKSLKDGAESFAGKGKNAEGDEATGKQSGNDKDKGMMGKEGSGNSGGSGHGSGNSSGGGQGGGSGSGGGHGGGSGSGGGHGGGSGHGGGGK